MKIACVFFSLLIPAAAAKWEGASIHSFSFEPNRGQAADGADFLAHAGAGTVFVRGAKFTMMAGTSGGLQVEFTGANRSARGAGMEPQQGVSNYLIGNNSRTWLRGVPHYSKVRYGGIYPGVDLIYYFNQANLEQDFVIAPGADVSRIVLRIDGARRVALDSNGDLLIETEAGTVREKKPLTYQESDGRRAPVEGRYVVDGRNVRFAIGKYDARKPLVIDPVILFSTYLGGGGSDQPQSIAVDAQGNAYVTGWTTSMNFPTKGALQPANGGGNDVFVTKIDGGSGAILYSTYLGGSGDDFASRIKVDSAGEAVITGTTYSTNFPASGGVQRNSGGGMTDAFVAKLNAAGNGLVFSTYLGGRGMDASFALDLDAQGNIYVGGTTDSPDFPLSHPALQNTVVSGFVHAFLTKINPAGTQLVYSTYFGGNGADVITALAVNSLQEPFIVGYTTSTNYPTSPDTSRWPTESGLMDGFMARIAASGFAIEYISYYGGSLDDMCTGITIEPDDTSTVYISGVTESPDFPTATGLPTGLTTGNATPFITKFALPNEIGSSLRAAQRNKADDYDWWVPIEPAQDPDWDQLIKDLEKDIKDTETTEKNLQKLIKDIEDNPLIKKLIETGLNIWDIIVDLYHLVTFTPPEGSSRSGPHPLATSSAPQFLFAYSSVDGSPLPAPQFPSGAAGALTTVTAGALDSSGNVYLAAQTTDATLPVSPAGARPGAAVPTGYVIRLADTGSSNGPVITSVANAFGGSTVIAPNTWVAVKGVNLAPANDSRSWQMSDFINNQMPTSLDGVRVTMNGINAYVSYISAGQVNVLTPPNLPSGSIQVVVNNGSSASSSFSTQGAAISPSLFVFGAGPYVVATHANYTDIGPTSLYPGLTTPAHAGETIVVYANGFGPTLTPIVAGSATQGGTLATMPVVQIGGLNANIAYAGLAAPGLYQFNVQIPSNAPVGDQTIVVQYQGASTQSGVLLTIQ